ncbi:MAG: flagellar biosynthetic protein FliR [Pseudomonadota bacterium]
MLITSAEVVQWVGAYLWPFIRISALFLVMPVFGSSFIPVQVRVLLSVGCTLMVVPLLPPVPSIDPVSIQGVLVAGHQVLIGIASGLAMQILIAIFMVGGQFIAIQMGLGFSTMIDPINGEQSATLGLFFSFIVTLLFIVMNGHLLVLNIIVESFKTLPVAEKGPELSAYWSLIEWAGKIFSGGTLVALPAVAALFLVNVAMGVMSRAAPQINLFSIGFSIYIFVGLFAILFTLSTVLVQFQTYLFEAINVLKQITKVS